MIQALSRCAVLALAVLAPAAFAATFIGSGHPVTETRAVSGFKSVALGIPGHLELTQGDQESLAITADDNVLPLIQTVVENGALKIRFKERDTNVNRATIRIVVNAKMIESLAVGGSGDIRSGPLTSAKLSVSVGGSGDVSIASIATGRLSADIGGSGNITINGGTADAVSASIAGSGDLAAGKLAARRVSVSLAGSGDASVWASDSLSVSMAGSGTVRYYGDAKVSRSIVGSGDVRRLGASPS